MYKNTGSFRGPKTNFNSDKKVKKDFLETRSSDSSNKDNYSAPSKDKSKFSTESRNNSFSNSSRTKFGSESKGNYSAPSSNRGKFNSESKGNYSSSNKDNSKFNSEPRSSSSGYKGNSKFNSTGNSFSPRQSSYGGRGGNRSSSRKFYTNEARGSDYSKYIKKATITKPSEEYKPMHTFNDFKITESLKKNIASKGYLSPTPIQDKTIEQIIEGKDMIGVANTGTGKTAAFLIPLINKIQANPNEKVLVIVPTRELASQIDDELKGFAKFMNIYSVQCIGGASISQQIYNLKKKYNFVIGTPGRLKDLVNRNIVSLGSFKSIVLDEVDRMVDMGFIDDMEYILSKLPTPRQSLFFSATISREVDVLIRKFLKNPISVSVKTQQTADNIDQDVVRISNHSEKIDKLHDLLIKEEVTKSLIFVKTKIGADKLDNELFKRGFKVASIHGDKSQYRRQQSLDKFKKNLVNVLVATDVAARGLDIPNVSHVINYDIPSTYEDYIHRIGRTGRANNKGNALTFVE